MRISIVSSVLLLVAGVGLTACGRDAGTREIGAVWEGSVLDSAGIRIVSNPASGIWTSETAWSVERDLLIGIADGPEEYQFGYVVDVDATQGRLYALDRHAARIRVFGEDGSYLYSFGGPGEGPGELSLQPPGPRAVLITPMGDVFVPDQSNARVNRFSTSGEFLGSFSIRMEQGLPVAWFTTPTGEYVAHHSSRTWNGLLRIASDGTVMDTLVSFEPRAPGVYSEGRREAMEHAALWTVLPGGQLASGVSDRFRIEIRSPEGELEMVITREPEMVPLSRAQQQRFLERLGEVWAGMFRDRGESEDWIRSQVNQVSRVYASPEHAPMFTGIAGGPAGTVWFRKALPIDSMTRAVLDGFRQPLQEFWSFAWEVFSEEGRNLGDITMPPGFVLQRIRGSHVYGLERDSLGVQHVVRLRIVMP
jgi:hypothetical protein